MADTEAIRSFHRSAENKDDPHCLYCQQAWRCDTAIVLRALDMTEVALADANHRRISDMARVDKAEAATTQARDFNRRAVARADKAEAELTAKDKVWRMALKGLTAVERQRNAAEADAAALAKAGKRLAEATALVLHGEPLVGVAEAADAWAAALAAHDEQP